MVTLPQLPTSKKLHCLIVNSKKLLIPFPYQLRSPMIKNKDGQPDSSKKFYENRDLLVEIKLDTDSPDIIQDIKSIQLTGLAATDGSVEKGTWLTRQAILLVKFSKMVQSNFQPKKFKIYHRLCWL